MKFRRQRIPDTGCTKCQLVFASHQELARHMIDHVQVDIEEKMALIEAKNAEVREALAKNAEVREALANIPPRPRKTEPALPSQKQIEKSKRDLQKLLEELSE